MTAPDWAALVQQTRDRIDQVEADANDPYMKGWQRDFWLRMATWARDVLDRHTTVTALTTEDCRYTGCCWDGCEVWSCAACGHIERDDEDLCPDQLAVLRAWVPDLLAAAGVES